VEISIFRSGARILRFFLLVVVGDGLDAKSKNRSLPAYCDDDDDDDDAEIESPARLDFIPSQAVVWKTKSSVSILDLKDVVIAFAFVCVIVIEPDAGHTDLFDRATGGIHVFGHTQVHKMNHIGEFTGVL
jgi:hypothetical protein